MKAMFLILVCIAFSGCATVPVPELNIKCTVGITKNDE